MSQMPGNFRLEHAQYRLGNAVSELKALMACLPAPKDVMERMPKVSIEIEASIELLDAYVESVMGSLPCPK